MAEPVKDTQEGKGQGSPKSNPSPYFPTDFSEKTTVRIISNMVVPSILPSNMVGQIFSDMEAYKFLGGVDLGLGKWLWALIQNTQN